MKDTKLTFVAHGWFSELGPSQPGSPTIPFMHVLTRKMIPPPHDTAHCDHAFHWFQVGHALSRKHKARVKYLAFNQHNPWTEQSQNFSRRYTKTNKFYSNANVVAVSFHIWSVFLFKKLKSAFQAFQQRFPCLQAPFRCSAVLGVKANAQTTIHQGRHIATKVTGAGL